MTGARTAIAVITFLAILMIGGIVFGAFYNSLDVKLITPKVSETITINSTASLGPYQLSYKPIVKGTVIVSIGSTVYQEGTDYTVDYTNGTITVIAGSALASATATATPVNVTYQYLGGQAYQTFVNMGATGWNALALFLIGAIVMAAGFIIALLIGWGRGGVGI